MYNQDKVIKSLKLLLKGCSSGLVSYPFRKYDAIVSSRGNEAQWEMKLDGKVTLPCKVNERGGRCSSGLAFTFTSLKAVVNSL